MDDMLDEDGPLGEIKRDRYGRPLIIQDPAKPDKTKAYTRATTFIKALDDTYNLQVWSQRRVARGLALRGDLLLAVQLLPDEYAEGISDQERKEVKKSLNDICRDAQKAAASNAKATIGTALHKMAERLDRGETFPIPERAKADLTAYQAAVGHFRVYMSETLVVQDQLCVAGTPDRVLNVDGEPVIADIKTGNVDFGIGTIAMQLGLYANSLRYDPVTGERLPFSVNKDRALVIHLPAGEGRCDLKWVDIAAGWEACQLAKQVHAWRKRKDIAKPYVPPADPLLARIANAETPEALTQLWKSHRNRWTPEMTEMAKVRKAALLAEEAE